MSRSGAQTHTACGSNPVISGSHQDVSVQAVRCEHDYAFCNTDPHIAECLESMLAQTYSNHQLILPESA